MSLRVRCRSCQAAFVTSKDQVGQQVECPKCGASQVVPKPRPAAPTDPNSEVEAGPALKRIKAPTAAPAADKSVFIAKKKKAKGQEESDGSGKGLWIALGLVVALVVVGAVGWPAFQKWLNPRPDGMVEGAAYDYLMALKEGDESKIAKLGVVQEPPAIRSFTDLKRDKPRDSQAKGEFKPISRLHKAIEKKFIYDQATGRFTPKDPLGPAAETLDALHDAKAKAEKDKTYEKMASGDPEEQMQAAIDFGTVFSKLSDGILNPKNLIPSYKMLVQGAKPPLTGEELALALDYASHREAWDGLLKRPFPTLKADGPFVYEKAEVTAQVKDKLGSSGDPPLTLRLKLVRFRMDAINTGWKVVSARRITPGTPDLPEDEDGPEPEISPQPAKPSPGDLPASPGLIPEGLPTDIIPK
jgi:DNA-directed RNA polymerase subunit RPC12/RpoP